MHARFARDCNMYVQWDIRYIQGLQRGVTAGEQPAPGSGGAGSRSGAGLRRCCCMQHIYTGSCRLGSGTDGSAKMSGRYGQHCLQGGRLVKTRIVWLSLPDEKAGAGKDTCVPEQDG